MMLKALFIFSFLVLFSNNGKTDDYSILTFGAKANDTILNTQAIQKAIDFASENGGGRVIIPKGTFLSGTIILKSGVELHLKKGAVLLGSTDISHYKKLNRWKALVMADGEKKYCYNGKRND